MGFNILRFKQDNKTQWGVLKGETIQPFAKGVYQTKHVLAKKHLATAGSIAKNSDLGSVKLGEVRVLNPITRPTRLLALGVNYASHREEVSVGDLPETLFFRKDESSMISATDDIIWPEGCRLLDYEVEMGIVMKKAITKKMEITPDNIEQYVAGVVIANDMSPRDFQMFAPMGQWYVGKSWRYMCPMGPYIHIFEEGEAAKLHDLTIKLWVNDDLRQDANTKDLIASPELALTRASKFVDLEPGDVILTGTPGGVALKIPTKEQLKKAQSLSPGERAKRFVEGQLASGRFLKHGDIIRCTLQSADGSIDCGEQVNRIVKE